MLSNNVAKLDTRLEQVFNELGNDLDPKMIDALTKLAREIRESLKYLMEFKGKLIHKRQDTIIVAQMQIVQEVLAQNNPEIWLDIKKKIYLTFVDENGDQQRIKLKVEGIFKTASTLFDRTNIYMKRGDLQSLLANRSAIHEIGIMCENLNVVDSKVDALNKRFTNNKIESWGQIAPELAYAQEIMGSFIYIFMGIILVALSFGIVNTMLMAVLERKKELGMLMSVGLNKRKVLSMVVFETLFISLVAAPIGIFLSYSFISYFGIHGIDLSSVGEGLEELGIGTRVFTKLSLNNYINVTILTLVVTFFSSLIPSRRALKLNPAEAVRAL